MGAITLSRRKQFNEALLATLPVSPSEMESLHGLAAGEGAGFPRILLDSDAREAVAKVTGRRIEMVAGTEEEIREAIERGYGQAGTSMERLVEQVGERRRKSRAMNGCRS